MSRVYGYVCELCERLFTSEESFLKHLKEKHTREEVEKLKLLAKLALENQEAYEELLWEMRRMEYFERKKGIKNE